MSTGLKLMQALAIFFNWLVALVFLSLPHLFYLGTTLESGEQPRIPFLVENRYWFYLIGVIFAGFTWIFWRLPRGWLWVPIGCYSFLTVFMALAQATAFRHRISEGLLLYAVTVFPLLVVVVASFLLSRWRRSQPSSSSLF